MSIRVIFAIIFVTTLSIYAWRRSWFISACGAILMMAVNEHPDMPKSVFGISGLNLWNILIANTTLAWLVRRSRQGYVWDLPQYVSMIITAFLLVVFINTLRLLFNMDGYNAGLFDGEDSEPESLAVFFNEYILNSIKWLLPAVVLFDGCRSRKEAFLALASILGMFFLLALQVIKHMPLSALTMDAGTLSRVASRILVGSLGYSRVTLSMLLAGASWAMLAVLPLIQRRKHKICILIAAGLVALGQALTGGRMGYVTFGIIGFILGFLRWRRLLVVFPVILLMALSFMPAVRDRMLMGFGSQTGPMVQKRDSEVITSGRSEVWPRVIASIEKAPWFGYGRRGMVVSGTHFEVSDLNGEADFTHPHNAYLEFLLDNGVIGGLFAFLLYGLFFKIALRLFLDRSDVLFGAVGGVAAALLLGLLVAGIGSQTLYPNHQSVGLWAALGVMLRVFIERARSRLTGESLFGEEESDSPVETSEEFPEPA